MVLEFWNEQTQNRAVSPVFAFVFLSVHNLLPSSVGGEPTDPPSGLVVAEIGDAKLLDNPLLTIVSL